ncbi:hypothetical protein HYR54_02770 [Candidatus Acetothermia bacterium]|nr:hypothetical protein [Candidatus Acetothermia bacterium]
MQNRKLVDQRIVTTMRLIAIAGLFALTLSINLKPGVAQPSALPTIQMGDFFFAVPGGPHASFKPGTPAQNILTLSGGAKGKIELNVENTGNMLHIFLSPLLTASEEVKTQLIDASGKVVGEVESSELRELELQPKMKAKLEIMLADNIKESLARDPKLTMVFEISCHAEGHYEAGMRALITVAP